MITDFLQRAEQRLRRDAPMTWNRGDKEMQNNAQFLPSDAKPKHAAVLVAMVARQGVLNLLLTQRHADLKAHAGQIAFPGGRIDADETPLQAALREAHEETGIENQYVSPLGYLDGYVTGTGFFITPVVALLQDGFVLQPQADEVVDIFEVPLTFLIDIKNRETHMREHDGKTWRYYAYPYEGRNIWGATAGMIKNMGDLLYGPPA